MKKLTILLVVFLGLWGCRSKENLGVEHDEVPTLVKGHKNSPPKRALGSKRFPTFGWSGSKRFPTHLITGYNPLVI